jgi:hypothetical protein
MGEGNFSAVGETVKEYSGKFLEKKVKYFYGPVGVRRPWDSAVKLAQKRKQNHGVFCMITDIDPSPTSSSTQYNQNTLLIN